MKRIVSVLVENKAGVLSRTAGLFARRGFNIESLAVGETEDPTISRMTIVAEGDERTLEQVEKQLNKQIDVIKVKFLELEASTRRATKGKAATMRGMMVATVPMLVPMINRERGMTRTIRMRKGTERRMLMMKLRTVITGRGRGMTPPSSPATISTPRGRPMT